MKTRTLTIIASILLCCCAGTASLAQEYVQTPVTVSKEKVRMGGKVYLSHVVLERQTLYSIAKAYGVTVQDIYDANRSLNLESEGLKKDQILLIPADLVNTKAAGQEQEENAAAAPGNAVSRSARQQQAAPQDISAKDEFNYHTVRWFEDLSDISEKYGVPIEKLMYFNGMTNKTVKRRQKIKIPTHPELIVLPDEEPVTAAVHDQDDKDVEKDGADAEEKTEKDDEEDDFSLGNLFRFRSNKVTATVLLPFNASGTPNSSYLDFYSGVLMAVRDLGNEGINIDLNVYDVANTAAITADKIAGSDLVIGPVTPEQVGKAVEVCPKSVCMAIPSLDSQVLPIVSEHGNVVLTPTMADYQFHDLIGWLHEEAGPADKVLLITEKGAKATSSSSALTRYLAASGIPYSTLSYGILEGRNIVNSMGGLLGQKVTNRVVIASESEAFVTDAVRNLNILQHRGYDIVLYGTTKLRSFDTVEVEDLHNLNLHISASYYIDYDNPGVASFLLAYRALYKTDPAPIAFQGYDTAKYFISLCRKYGKSWPRAISRTRETGFQGDFNFIRKDDGGYINNAIRRIVYEPDYNIRLVR